MQINKSEIMRQQLIMAHLKYYKNKIDGIWGPASIAAKKSWENSPAFVPAFPNQGLPFGAKDVLPKGVSFDRKTRIMQCVGLSDTVEAEIMARQSPDSKQAPSAVAPESSVVVREPVAPVEAAESSEPKVEVQQPVQNNQQNHQKQHHNQHNQKRN